MDGWDKFTEISLIEKYLYSQSDTLLLVYVLGNFRNMCLEIYRFDSAHKIFSS